MSSQYYARQQKAFSMGTVTITDLMRERVPFKDWPEESQQLMAVALYPRNRTDSEGRWTIEARAALNLLRHLFKNGHFLRMPEHIQNIANALSGSEYTDLELAAFKLRQELVVVTPAWFMDALMGEAE